MLKPWAVAVVTLGCLAGPAAAVVIPAPPKDSGEKAPATVKRQSAPKAATPAPSAAPPVNPLLVRRRGAPPSRASDDYAAATRLARGQAWSVNAVGSDASNCVGVLRIVQESSQVFTGPFQLTCSGAQASYSFRQEATLIDAGDSILVSLRAPTGAPQAPQWTQLRLTKQGPGHLSGAANDGPRTTALTLRLAGS